MIRRLRPFGPAIAAPAPTEALRAGLGAALGIALAGLGLWALTPQGDPLRHLLLIAPFGASAVLINATPNSPLAQPWAVVVGNTVSALAALLVVWLVAPPLLAAALAVGAAMLAMAALRATHPPGGAVALLVALNASLGATPAPLDLLLTVAAGSALLVGAGIAWNLGTGRPYPFGQTTPAGTHATADPTPAQRFAPTEADLAALLDQTRTGANIGIADLSSVLQSAADLRTAHRLGDITAAQIMSRDLVTVAPDTPLPALADAFRHHRFKSLPIRRANGSYGGLVPELALVGGADPNRTAADVADASVATVIPQTGLARLIDLLADGRQQAVPVLESGRLAGLITRSDLIALLAHALATGDADDTRL